jgi:hypothetical protein
MTQSLEPSTAHSSVLIRTSRDPCLYSISSRPDFSGDTPKQVVATLTGTLLPRSSPAQLTRITPSTGKKRFNTHKQSTRSVQ